MNLNSLMCIRLFSFYFVVNSANFYLLRSLAIFPILPNLLLFVINDILMSILSKYHPHFHPNIIFHIFLFFSHYSCCGFSHFFQRCNFKLCSFFYFIFYFTDFLCFSSFSFLLLLLVWWAGC
jgi:hypothetical protein